MSKKLIILFQLLDNVKMTLNHWFYYNYSFVFSLEKLASSFWPTPYMGSYSFSICLIQRPKMYKRLDIPSHAQNMHVGHFSEEVIFWALAMILGTFGKGILKQCHQLEVTYFLVSYVLILRNWCFQDVWLWKRWFFWTFRQNTAQEYKKFLLSVDMCCSKTTSCWPV